MRFLQVQRLHGKRSLLANIESDMPETESAPVTFGSTPLFEELTARPAVEKGMAVTPKGPAEDPTSVSDEERARRAAMLYNQRARPAPV